MSFKRASGWIMTSGHFGFLSHYFPENQTKALCGASCANLGSTTPHPMNARICRTCLRRAPKSSKVSNLTV